MNSTYQNIPFQMSLLDVLLTTSSTSLIIGVVIYLMRNLIATRLTKSVQHEFDAKLSKINSLLRVSEESLKADLVRKQADIHALQNGAIQGRLSRLIALEKRRLEAVDQIWGAVHGLSFAKGLAASMAVFKWKEISEEVAKNPRAKEVFAAFKVDPEKTTEPVKLAQQARPFITPVAWAYYAAYQSILMHAVALVRMLELGVDAQKFMDSKNLISLIKTALPHCSEYIDQHGPNAAYYLVDQLENSLLAELKNMLDGSATDIAEVTRANQILREASRVNQSVSESQSSADVLLK
ncbi:MAG: hypothetical protein NTZ15_21115 [Burkholderiales bacterium]|nr:hypothetical protein [Burkholderiales bacterium]